MAETKFDTTAIENERKALQLLAEEVQKTDDADARDALIDAIQKSADKLKSMCEALQAEADKVVVPKIDNLDVDAVVEVVLTPEQRSRVLKAFGVDVPSVRIPDATGVLTKNMAHIEPDYIEECAMKQAKAFKEMCEEIENAAE